MGTLSITVYVEIHTKSTIIIEPPWRKRPIDFVDAPSKPSQAHTELYSSEWLSSSDRRTMTRVTLPKYLPCRSTVSYESSDHPQQISAGGVSELLEKQSDIPTGHHWPVYSFFSDRRTRSPIPIDNLAAVTMRAANNAREIRHFGVNPSGFFFFLFFFFYLHNHPPALSSTTQQQQRRAAISIGSVRPSVRRQ